MFLGELQLPVSRLKGIGPGAVKALSTLSVHTVSDLIRHFPRQYEDRQTTVSFRESTSEQPVNTRATVTGHTYIGGGPKRTLKVSLQDDSGSAALVCFGRNFLEKKLKTGIEIRLYGNFERRYGELQSSSFDFETDREESGFFDRILPLYPLAEGLNQKQMRKAVKQALDQYISGINEELPHSLLKEEDLLGYPEALRTVHFPSDPATLAKARKTLIFHELFLMQLHLARKAAFARKPSRRPGKISSKLQERLLAGLPFELTPDQKKSLQTIQDDLEGERPMTRLIQGDVGSGKTLVGFLAALPLIEGGKQAAFMAPTELLARQHADNAARLLEPLGVRLAFLTGNLKAKGRRRLLEELSAGRIDLVIGTHALFSEEVVYADLGLVIVDEQHRFGVLQRKALAAKADHPDILLMTATPIPRTLTLTAFGDLDVSLIQTMPQGRIPVETHLARQGNERKVYDFVKKEVEQGRQAYFVYPLIGSSEKSDLKDAEGMFDLLSTQIFPQFKLGLIHSQIEEDQKRGIMEDFKEGKIDLLVATSVVEVGVDIPNATLMVIEHAERFGLSALHQLRGRVGRGDQPSYCFLIFSETLTEDGKKRLLTMKSTSDGFAIAEADLAIRGPGEMTGLRQSGFLHLDIADLIRDRALLEAVRERARAIVDQDPGFLLPENERLLHLFSEAPPYPEDSLSGV